MNNNLSFKAGLFFDLENYFAATADFNGDGISDRVSLGENIATVSLGRADGTFGNGIDYAVGDNAEQATIADFNNDGNVDIAVANSFFEEDVSLLLGNGDGTFAASSTFGLGRQPLDIVAGDFNNDGIVDLATPNRFSDFASVLIGVGDGTFNEAVNYTVEDSATSITSGDLNGDGIEDLIAGSERGSVSILVGRGDGTFADAITTNFDSNSFFVSVSAADFNDDGLDDLAFTNNNGLTILLSNGDGTLATPLQFAVGNGAKAPTPGDFNGDGLLDLAVANYDTPYGSDVLSTVSILLGNGDGTFTDDVQYTVGDGAKEIGVGDFNGDGVADLAVANVFSNFVSVLIGVGDGTFNSTNNIATNTGVKAVSVDDLDGDGIADLVIADRNDEIIILNGEGNGNFTPGESFSSGAFDLNTLTTADLDNDGNPDVAAVRDSDVAILLNEGNGSLQSTPRIDVPGTVSLSVANGDFDGDGIPDLVVADGNISILISNGDDSFAEPVVKAIAEQSTDVAVADLDGDGNLDLVVTSTDEVDRFNPGFGSNGRVSVLLGNSDGTFDDAVAKDIGGEPRSIAIGDVNGDGIVDLAIGDLNRDVVSVLLGNGNGTFGNAVNYNAVLPAENREDFRNSTIEVKLEDFDGDGNIDIVTGNDNSVVVLSGKGDGTFVDTPFIPEFNSDNLISVADFDGDGNRDLFGFREIRLGNGDGTFGNRILPLSDDSYASIATSEDFNGDGFDDLVINRPTIVFYAGAIIVNDISVRFSNGDGSFSNETPLIDDLRDSQVGKGDFNGDGITDIAVSNNISNYVRDPGDYYGRFELEKSQLTVLLSNNDGSFSDPINTDTRDNNAILVVADLDNDGIDDVITSEVVQFGNGDGTFTSPIPLENPFTVTVDGFSYDVIVAPGDFNGDGNIDLVTAAQNFNNENISILLGNGDGTFNNSGEFATGLRPINIAVADYNGDGIEDVAVSNQRDNNVALFVSNGDGTFEDAVKFSVGRRPNAIASGDLDNNGSNDLLVVNPSFPDGISVLLNNNNPTTPVNTPPIAVADSFTTDESQIITGNVLNNDSDRDGDSLVVTAINGNSNNIGNQITLASGVTLTLNSNGTFNYNPNSAFDELNQDETATDNFSYTISDGRGGTDTAVVTITINGIGSSNTIIGTKGNDILNGTAGNDIFNSIAGNDLLNGFAGNDLLQDDIGRDTLFGGNGNDTLIGGRGGDDLRGQGDNDLLQGDSGNDTLFGNNGNDTLVGGGGNDLLQGDRDDDVLDGGIGNDTLFGAAGSDLFVLKSGEGTDLIRDYFDGTDRFVLEGGLEFADIEVVQQINSTQIKVTATGEILANLNSVTANVIDESDFAIAD